MPDHTMGAAKVPSVTIYTMRPGLMFKAQLLRTATSHGENKCQDGRNDLHREQM